MSSPTPEHYLQILKDVEQNWAVERLLLDFRAATGNSELTKAQVGHLKALLAWGDLKATGQLELGDRFTHPNKIIAQLLSVDEKSVRTEISRSITPCIKQLLDIDPSTRIKIEAIPGWLREKGYGRSKFQPELDLRGETQPLSCNGTKSNHNHPVKANLGRSNTEQFTFLNAKKESDLPTLYGREPMLQRLNSLLYTAESRLIFVHGRSGVGKTRLVKQWMEAVQSNFSYSIWRQSWDHPPLAQMVWDIIQQLPNYTKADMPDSAHQQITGLISALCAHKCLVVLDEIHYLFQANMIAAQGRSVDGLSVDGDTLATTEVRGYEILFEQLVTNQDYQQSESCVVGIGWYRPPIVAKVEDLRSPISTLELQGLDFEAAQHILADCQLMDDPQSWKTLVDKYRGVPYLLKLVGHHISKIYEGDTRRFLADETIFLGDAESLIHEQFLAIADICKSKYIADLCKLICLVLSKGNSCASTSGMRDQLNQEHQLSLSTSDVGRSLQTLYEMQLIEKDGDWFSPPPDIAKYALKQYQMYLPHLIERLRSPEL